MSTPTTVTADDIRAAYRRITTRIRRTPVLEAEGAAFGAARPVSLKLELFQHAGSFKARGAFNNLLSRDIGPAGVAAASGGNHGIAVALAARALSIPARIFVPEISSPAKVARLRSLGADVVVTGAAYADALAACEAWRAQTGAEGVHAFATPQTVAGQGTLAIEWERQAPDLDTLLVAVGGGGLIAGVAAHYAGRARVIAVEPERAPSLHAALAAGRPVDVEVGGVAADALGARSVGELNFAICREHVAASLLVPDAAIGDAQAALWRDFRIAAEPGGATALAALAAGVYKPGPEERVGVLVCGGNVDPATLA
ncbi:MAG: threonine/serine dehydratase [Flavobacteriaceae bacterium]